jgi:hypothetical protein
MSRCSESLTDPEHRVGETLSQSNLIRLRIPGKGSEPRLVIGHNVSYDRARTAEEFNIKPTGTRLENLVSQNNFIVVNFNFMNNIS